ncbi:MAG: FAD-dependent monooxygenase [SAR324 cluster bacterium]|nr:FAD-dependent monooxygenase [SAR324 cluster bacterium]
MVEADEIVVLGGGPAGCLAGACLSRAGYRVSLVSDFKVRPAHEGLSGRTIEALQLAGFRRSLDRVGPPVPRTLHWNGETAQANEESLIERGPFDEGLRADALAAGVRVIHGRALEARHISRGWSVRIACIDGTRTELNGGFLVEARGRTAPTGRRRGRRGPPATALLSTWELPTHTRSFTSVAAFSKGWAWWASGGCGRSYLQLVVSGERGTIPGKAALEGFYDELLNQVAEAPGWLAGARRVGRIAGRSAGTIIHGELIGDRWLRLGDAAVAGDPLSGHGIYYAASAALALPAIVNTLLKRCRQRELAFAFYTERMEKVFLHHGLAGRDHYRNENRWPDESFWRVRRVWPEENPGRAVAPGAAVIEPRPVIDGDYVESREVVITHDHPRGVWRIDQVPLVPLLRYLISERPRKSELLAKAVRFSGREPGQVENAVGWLRHWGLL